MGLDQHGLYGDVMRGEKRERFTEGKLLEGQSEERIFETLGMPWRPLEHRKYLIRKRNSWVLGIRLINAHGRYGNLLFLCTRSPATANT